MYRILLVDDEWLELDTLEKYIPWEEMGFQVAGTAENGKEALQLLERLEGSENEEENDRKLPDVVLTDVKMPVMDGLAFSKILHDRYPDIQIVFLSGYNDFEYVRYALAVEACGYILKPLNTEELKGTMEKVREKCSRSFWEKKSQAVVTAENFRNLLGFSAGEKEVLWEDICRSCNTILHCGQENRSFYVGMITIDEYRFLSGYESNGQDILNTIDTAIRRLSNDRILPLHINDYSYLLLSGTELNRAASRLLEQQKEAARWITVCLYENRRPLEQMPVLCQEMSRFRQWHVKMYGSGHIILCDGQKEARKSQEKEKPAEYGTLIACLQNGEKEEIKKLELPAYKIIDGAESTWTQNTNTDGSLVIRGDGAIAKFKEVRVDGVVIDVKNYTVTEGSTIITLKTEYLKTLPAGKHTFEIAWTDGSAATYFTVAGSTTEEDNKLEDNKVEDNTIDDKKAEDNNVENSRSDVDSNASLKTGDTTDIRLWLILLMSALTIMTGLTVKSKRNDCE